MGGVLVQIIFMKYGKNNYVLYDKSITVSAT